MKKVKLRKRKRKLWFQYLPWIPIRYYTRTRVQILENGDYQNRTIGRFGKTTIITERCKC